MSMVSSVTILKEINEYKKERSFYHDVTVGEGVAIVTAKVIKVEDVLVLRSRLDFDLVDLTGDELNLIEKLYIALLNIYKGKTVRVTINAVELQSALRLNATERFRGIDQVIYHMKATYRLEEEELDRWRNKLGLVLDDLMELKDVTSVFKRIYLDDGLTMFNSIVEKSFINNKGVQEGDVVDVTLMEPYITSEEGYVVAMEEKGNMVGIEDITKIMRGVF